MFFIFMLKLTGDFLGCSLGHMDKMNYDSNSQRRYLTTLPKSFLNNIILYLLPTLVYTF